jgi:branched-chain amino acid transport system substrate-binding protein
MTDVNDEKSCAPESRPVLGESLSRRQFLKWAGVTGAAVGMGGALVGCGGDDETTTTAAPTETTAAGETTTSAAAEEMGREVKVGWVTMTTGPLASLSEPDDYLLEQTKAAVGDGLVINGTKHPVTWVVKDSQSDSNRAAEVAGELITQDQVDLMMVGMTPIVCNPVADQCEANGMPLISYGTPWQAWFFGRNGDPAVGFEWTYHFFWGAEDMQAVYISLWDKIESNKVVGALWPNDADGAAMADPEAGFPPAMEAAGYTLVDPGRFPNLTEDYSSIISQFKEANVEIVTGLMIAPDFPNFWSQAVQQGFTPKMVTMGRAILVRPDMEAIGPTGNGLCTEVWWASSHPFVSSLTGQTCEEVAKAWEDTMGSGYNASLGLTGAAFEVAVDTLKRVQDIDDPTSIVEAIKTTDLQTVLGPINFQTGPVPNISKTPLVGGQWQLDVGEWPWTNVVVDTSHYPEISTSGDLIPLGG